MINRRMFLGQALAGSCAIGAASAEPRERRIIDTHTHFYDPSRPQGVPWPSKDDTVLYRTTLPNRFREVTGPFGKFDTVVVEASPWVEDNQWLLDIAKEEPCIVGIVGNLSPADEKFPELLRRFAKSPLYRGIRINAADMKAGLKQARYVDNLRRLADLDLELDVNNSRSLLPEVAHLATLAPNLRILINHVANLAIDGKSAPPDWLAGMRSAAACPNVFCKVSALVEGTGRRNGDAPSDLAYYKPVLDALWEIWGVNRLIYGSNWPVSDHFATYKTVFGIVDQYFRNKGPEAADRFFANNAKSAYKWVKR